MPLAANIFLLNFGSGFEANSLYTFCIVLLSIFCICTIFIFAIWYFKILFYWTAFIGNQLLKLLSKLFTIFQKCFYFSLIGKNTKRLFKDSVTTKCFTVYVLFRALGFCLRLKKLISGKSNNSAVTSYKTTTQYQRNIPADCQSGADR